MHSDREYRILVDGESVTAWTSDLNGKINQILHFREIFTDGEVVSLEVSPWYWEGKTATCSGCHYAACPVGGK